MWLLYQLAYLLLLLLAGPFLLIRRGHHYLRTLSGRCGAYQGEVPDAPLWIHAVSVGEVGAAATLIPALPDDLPLLVTTITPTGQTQARKLVGERATVAYLPFDLDPPISRFLDRFQPRGLVLTEGDLWPLLLRRLADRHLPVVVVNGRVSDHSFRRMMRLKPLLGPLFDPVSRFGMQTDEDGRRLRNLGVSTDKIKTLGNIKFDSPMPTPLPEIESKLGDVAAGRPILIAGSTMPGEEQLVLESWSAIGGGQRSLLIIAPRHPERFSEVSNLTQERGVRSRRRSELLGSDPIADVVVLDTLGELAALYRIALGSFIGGTLVPTGGHNPIEAAQHGSAVVVGPSMENFREIADVFSQAEAWRQVTGTAELSDVFDKWITEPATARAIGARGKEVVDANRGALERTRIFLEPLTNRGESQ